MSRIRLNTLLTVCIWVAVVAMGLVGEPAAQAASLGEEALARIQQDGFTGDRFTFCVLGDSHGKGMAEVLSQNVKEMNLLDPAFIIEVGDALMGYTSDARAVHKEWDEFLAIVATSRVPYMLIPGNHDTWDWQSQAIFKERVGPVAFSFDYGNSHFICLTTDEPANWIDYRLAYLGQAQICWLKEDLAAHSDATHIFIFVHKPTWVDKSNWLAEIHPLLTQYPVKALFAGHHHIYRKDVVDGIPCFITSGGGPSVNPGPGGFHHFMHISVKGDQVRFAVVKTGSVVSEDVVTGKVIETGQ